MSDGVTRRLPAALSLMFLTMLAGCETPSPAKSGAPRAAAPTARYNLAGYSEGFKQGYVDACGTPSRRNAERFKSDSDYRMGWTDGQSLCKK